MQVLAMLLAALVTSAACAQIAPANPSCAPACPPPPMAIPSSAGSYGFSGIGVVKANVDLLSSPARLINWSPAPALPRYPMSPWSAQYAGGSPWRSTPGYPIGQAVGGSGFSVNGAYSGDRWRLGFHLGSGAVGCAPSACGPYVSPPVCSYPLWGWTTRYGAYWGSSYPYYATYSAPAYGPATYGYDPRLSPAYQPASAPLPTQAAPPEPPSAVETGKQLLAIKQPRYAVESFRNYLKEQGSDAEVMRLLSVALASNKKLSDAAAVMRAAYRLNPALAASPIDLAGLGFSEREFRDLTARCVAAAHKADTGSSWLLVAALMQAQGRAEPARRMLDKARHAGLESAIADPMQVELDR